MDTSIAHLPSSIDRLVQSWNQQRTLDAVLDPSLRPAIFRRSFEPGTRERLAWPYEEVAAKGGDVTVYDATRPTYRNTGHTFAAGLFGRRTPRRARVLEDPLIG